MTLLAADQLDWYVGKPWAMIIDVRNRREYERACERSGESSI